MVNAIVTFLFTSSYLPGTLILGKSLRQLNIDKSVKLVVLLATSLTSYEYQLLSSIYDEIIETGLIHSKDLTELDLLKRPELSPTYSKINLFNLVQFDKLLYLDSDTLPLQDLTHLFQNEITSDQILASPDSGWPDIFNTGLFLIKPNQSTYEALLNKIQNTVDKAPSFDGADQGLLNEFFTVDSPRQREWIKLPFLYNVTPSGQYQYQPAFQFFHNDIKLLHFIGAEKPWSNGVGKDGEKWRWWDKYFELFGYGSIKETIHGITPRFYTPLEQPTETKPTDSVTSEELIVEEVERTNYYEEATTILSNPSTFEIFETFQPNENQWDPARDEPPQNGEPEAKDFPDLNHYFNEWDRSKVNDDSTNHIDENQEEYQEHQNDEQQEVYYDENENDESNDVDDIEDDWKPTPIFPWEFHQTSYKPERTFTTTTTDDYSFDNPWKNLPIFQKIKSKRSKDLGDQEQEIRQAQMRASQLAKEEEIEEMKRRGKEVAKISADVEVDDAGQKTLVDHSKTDMRPKDDDRLIEQKGELIEPEMREISDTLAQPESLTSIEKDEELDEEETNLETELETTV